MRFTFFITFLSCWSPCWAEPCPTFSGHYRSKEAGVQLSIQQDQCVSYSLSFELNGVHSTAIYLNDHNLHLDPLAQNPQRYYKMIIQQGALNIEFYRRSAETIFLSLGVDAYFLNGPNHLHEVKLRQHYESPEPGTVIIVSDPQIDIEFERVLYITR